ncbi:ribonuclease III [Desulfococcaceae bacterium OttesenSCG-928-F15]|nr:ribonuclease III [Desulfococcaceae bacterium OttesenSCG-928-F15]
MEYPGNTLKLQKEMGHKFKSPFLLETALSHTSFANEQAGVVADNERLEFLGDAVLNLVIGHLLMDRFRDIREGDLSRVRSSLVNESRLAGLARSLFLGKYLRLGRGEIQTQGQNKDSILADAFEAIVAAVYLDGGFDAAFSFVERRFEDIFMGLDPKEILQDSKSRFQEEAQMRYKITPQYKTLSEEGPDHEKTFCVEVQMKHIRVQGTGKSKKLAEQDAARRALELMRGQ